MSDTYDVAIIGGGHNGLVAAGYLAKAGRRVVVLEKKEMIGGIAVTEELFQGFKASSLLDGSNSFSPEVIRDLNLAGSGLEIFSTDPLIFAPQKDGKHLTIWHDVTRTANEIADFSRPDADAYPAFIKEMDKFARILAAVNWMTLPDMPDAGLGDLLKILKLVKPIRGLGWKNITQMMRILPMSVSDLMDQWFESEAVKAAIAASALNNISLGPQESGTTYAFLQNCANSNNGLFRASGQVKGGIGSLTKALADAAQSFGAKIFTQTQVTRIIVEKGRAAGVVLFDGKTIRAATVLTATDMRSTFKELIAPGSLDETTLKRVENITYNGTMARVHFALNSLPDFTGMTGNPKGMLKGHIQIAPTINDLQKAFDPVKYGQFTDNPYLDITIPSLGDPSLAPTGKHLMSVTVKYMPYHLREGNWEALSDPLAQLVIKTITGYVPDFQKIVQDYHVITPLDMEKDYNLPEGSLVHGDITLDQSLWMRPIPGYTQNLSPVKGLYMCGASTHPGAGVTGINGSKAAQRILKDKNR
jgi:phytoene dehydrogenase-like protein